MCSWVPISSIQLSSDLLAPGDIRLRRLCELPTSVWTVLIHSSDCGIQLARILVSKPAYQPALDIDQHGVQCPHFIRVSEPSIRTGATCLRGRCTSSTCTSLPISAAFPASPSSPPPSRWRRLLVREAPFSQEKCRLWRGTFGGAVGFLKSACLQQVSRSDRGMSTASGAGVWLDRQLPRRHVMCSRPSHPIFTTIVAYAGCRRSVRRSAAREVRDSVFWQNPARREGRHGQSRGPNWPRKYVLRRARPQDFREQHCRSRSEAGPARMHEQVVRRRFCRERRHNARAEA